MSEKERFSCVKKALESILPYIYSHEGDIELVNIQNNIVYIRLKGACSTCPISAITVKLGIEDAIKEQVPDITQVVVVED